MDIKTKLYNLLAVVLMISCHKDKTPEKGLPVLREGIYRLYCNENTSSQSGDYFYIKQNSIYLTVLLNVYTPACLNRAAGKFVFSSDSLTKPVEILVGHESTDSCYFDNDVYGGKYGIYFLSKGKANYFDGKIESVSGTFTLDYPGYNDHGTYRLLFIRSYPQ